MEEEELMIYKEIGKSDMKCSCVSLGTWELAGNVWGSIDENSAVNIIHAAIDNGITLIDTAASYGGGRSEIIVGKALAGRREKVVLSTKGGAHFNPAVGAMDHDLTPAAIRRDVEDSLSRLKTDCIDLYFFHYPDPNTPIADSIGEMEKLRKEGKIKLIGLSNYTQEETTEAMKYGTIDCAQFRFSMLTRENKPLVEFCAKNGIGVLSYASLAGGMLSGAYKTEPKFDENDRRTFFYPFLKEPEFSRCRKLVDIVEKTANEEGVSTANAAIQWVIAQKGMTSALVGTKNTERAKKNAEAFDVMLSHKDFAYFDKAYQEIFG